MSQVDKLNQQVLDAIEDIKRVGGEIESYPCPNCQGEGCFVCNGHGIITR